MRQVNLLHPAMKSTSAASPCRVEIYEDSFANGPAASFETPAPQPVRVGEVLDGETWPEAEWAGRKAKTGRWLRVKAVNITRLQVAGAPAGRSLSICVEVVARA